LREALLNALAHRDYAFSASTLISIFDDRIEFVSMGGLPRGITMDDILLGISVQRNANLANVLYRLKLIEAYGTGIPKMMRSYEDCAEKPLIQVTDNAFKITLPDRNISKNNSVAAGFSENEKSILALFSESSTIARKDVETALTVSQAMAVRLLKELVDKGAIKTVGNGKQRRYEKRSI
jgi:ATP-dependent DNA helicase RecG